MSAFVSQATNDAPTILLLAENSSLTKKIKKLFIDNGFEVCLVLANNYSSDQLQSLANQQFYKIVLIYGFVQTNLQTFNDFFDFFTSRAEPKIAITPWPRDLQVLQTSAHEFYNDWLRTTQEQNQIYQQLQKINVLKIFVLDLVFDEVLINPFSFSLQLFKQQVILDPDTAFGLIGVDQLLKSLSFLLIKPFSIETHYFQGKLQPSLKIINAIKGFVSRFYQKELAVRKLPTKNTFLEPAGQLKTVISDDLNDIIDKPLRNLADYLAKLPKKNANNWQNLEEKAERTEGLLTQNTPNLKDIKKAVKEEKELNNQSFLKQAGREKQSKQNEFPPLQAPQPKKPKLTKQKVEQNLDKELASLFVSNRQQETTQRQVTKIKQIKQVTKKTKKKKTLFYLGLFFSVIGTLIVMAFLFFMLNFNQVKRDFVKVASDYLENQEINQWKLDQTISYKLLTKQLEFYPRFLSLAIFDEANQLIKISKQMSDWQKLSEVKEKISQDLYEQILSTQSQAVDQEKLANLPIKTQQIFESIAQSQAQVKQIKKASFSSFKNFNLDNFNQALLALQKQNSAKLSFEQQLKQILAVEGKQTYALLLQDNQELRPSGGFIQAIALLDFQKGQLIDHRVYGIYQLDQMIPGNVALPEEMKPYLAEEKWFIHDANWEVDFPTTANQLGWFLKQATNQQIDGVFTLSYESLASLLVTTGEINLAGFDQTLDNKNFFNRVESQIENTTNQQNKYYAQEVLEQFLAKLVNLPPEKSSKLLTFYFNQLESNQEFVVFFKPELQQVIKELSWDGGLVKPQCPSSFMVENCLIDSLYINETNIGLNKVNRYIQRQANHQVTFQAASVKHHYQLDLTNSAFSNNFPLGSYKGYLRIYLPEGSNLDEVRVNKNQLTADKFYQTKVKGFNLLGLVIEVPINQTTKLEVFYSQNNPYQNNFAYVFLNQKQAGLSPTPIATSISFEAGFKPSIVAPQAEIFNNNIVFNTESGKHDFFAIKFE